MRLVLTIVFFVFVGYAASAYFTGESIEEQGGLKGMIVEFLKDTKDVWTEIRDYDPDGASETPSEK